VWFSVLALQTRAVNLEDIRDFALSLPAVSEDLPFGPDTLVFKVYGKIFMLFSLDQIEQSVNLKCDPEKAIELRDRYSEVVPGFHMNKKHWNTIHLQGNITQKLLREWIQDSYRLVVAKVPKKDRNLL
jgi:predicted DNA-binding protein (MmcQ/YjbR family)